MQYLGRLNTQNYLIQNKKEILGKVVLANLETRHKAFKKKRPAPNFSSQLQQKRHYPKFSASRPVNILAHNINSTNIFVKTRKREKADKT